MSDIHYADHTDSVARKLELLQAAYAAGKFDIAMSLAASLKETLSFERQKTRPADVQLSVSASLPVSRLPALIAQWARGWAVCKPVTLFETVGVPRANDPVDLSLAFNAAELSDPVREIRVARWDGMSRRLLEIPSQVYDHARHDDQVRCRVAFGADVGAHDSASYLIFAGNPHAERPEYSTDLRVDGEGYGLDITNSHYVARLSRQTGQLERLTYAREHGLELYAGGKGHGEPPDIDWGHDYVDQGSFQKLRMRNWAACPNYEVIRGPLFVQLRRWGFPASPMHPLFTPARMHMDVTYTFYAGLPYFLKHSRMDMVQDLRIEAMRDDEWVFSGYSFTDMLWIDASGKLHEGAVPADQTEGLWGVGFFNRTSRDAFVALRLVHQATGEASIAHGGAPTMHYAGHGQLWSRYPAQQTQMKSGVTFEQKNAYMLAPYPEQNPAEFYERSRHALLNSLEIKAEMPDGLAGAAVNNRPLARDGETPESAPLKTAIWKVLREVRDEQLYTTDANVVDMGLICDVSHRAGVVRILMTMPHRGRPVYQFFASQGGGRVSEGIRERLLKLSGVREVIVDFTWEPEWTTARLTDAGRTALGLSN